MRSEQATSGSNRLQRELAQRIVDMIRVKELKAGERLPELRLAQQLRVSRTPVRAALSQLEQLGIVERSQGRGFVLRRDACDIDRADVPAGEVAEEQLIIAIAQERLNGNLPDEVTETDIRRRFGAVRQVVARALASLAESGVVSRNPGYGWRFEPRIDDQDTLLKSYEFRLFVEPKAMLLPSFSIDRKWVVEMRQEHEQKLAEPWSSASSAALFEMNARFHEGIALASGNRFFHLAVHNQNLVSRFRKQSWTFVQERALVSFREHIVVLDHLERGDNELASVFMRRHLENSFRSSS